MKIWAWRKVALMKYVATMGDAESRTAMNSNSVVWSIGDEIGIFVTNGSSSTYTNINYSLSSGAGTKNAGSQEYWKVRVL